MMCLTIILDVPQGQQEALTYQHNVTYQMPESSATPLPQLQASKVQETFLAVGGRSAKHRMLPYTSPCNMSQKLGLLQEIGAKAKGMTEQFDLNIYSKKGSV